MGLFIEKCKDAIERTKSLWDMEGWSMLGYWVAKKWYEVELKDAQGDWRWGVMAAVPFVSPVTYVVLPFINTLINGLATLAVWLVVPVTTLIHKSKDNSRRQELLARIDEGENSLLAKLATDEKSKLNVALDSALVHYDAKSEPSKLFKDRYFANDNANSLERRINDINAFISEEDSNNAGRDISGAILSALRLFQGPLPTHSKTEPTSKNEVTENPSSLNASI